MIEVRLIGAVLENKDGTMNSRRLAVPLPSAGAPMLECILRFLRDYSQRQGHRIDQKGVVNAHEAMKLVKRAVRRIKSSARTGDEDGSMESIIVTGASSGIGLATATRLADAGYFVFAGVRKEADRERLSTVHAQLRPIILDVTVPADVTRTIDAVRAAGHPLRAIVNNAGVAVAGPLEFLPLEALRSQFEVNVFGPIALTQAALPLLRETQGRIVFIGSISGRLSAPFVGPYSASKSALASLGDALRQELAPFGIAVSTLEFANVKTPIWEKGRAGKDALVASMPPQALTYYSKLVDAIIAQTRREEKTGMDPSVIAATVQEAIQAPRPRERYLVGRKARMQSIAAMLPPRTRDALVKKAMQLP